MDFSKIKTYPISQRLNKFHIKDMIQVDHQSCTSILEIGLLAERMKKTREMRFPILVMLGGAVIKEGCSLLLIDLIKKGFITHLAMNGAVSIHDFEIALIGQTSEDPKAGLFDGTFGMVEETSIFMNSAIEDGYKLGIGYGRSIATKIDKDQLPYREYSIIYSAYKMNLPISVHIAIGGDFIHQHPSCNGAALGATSYRDFQILTETICKINSGVIINIGSAVILPEVFLKALTIARNLGYLSNDFTIANFDFLNMYRPRTRIVEWPASLGAMALNVHGRHNETIPQLHKLLATKTDKQ